MLRVAFLQGHEVQFAWADKGFYQSIGLIS
jgi:hypothetical protein